MADSFQNEVPKARINLKLDLHTGGASKKMELPLKLLVAGDFSNGQESAQISEREKVNITKNNFDSVLSEYSPKLNLTVKNTLSDDGGEENVQLTFQSMKDFTPEQVAAQINLMSGSSMLSFIHKNTSAKKLLDAKLITTEQIERTALNYIVQAQQLVNSGRINEHPLSPIIDILFASLQRSFVCCFSKNATNHLLWSHYADSHRGYCLRYKKEILLHDIKPHLYGDVVYDDTSIDLISAVDDFSNISRDIIFRKSSCWAYEDEVRLIHNDIAENEASVSKVEVHTEEALDCVILGYSFDMSKLDELKAQFSNNEVKFKKIVRSSNSYKLFVSTECY